MIDINFKNGKIAYDDFNIDLLKDIKSQLDFLKEDLLQVSFENNFILDLGWYPEFDINGNFILQVIKHNDWDKPIFKKRISYSSVLYEKINEALTYIS